MVDDQQVDDEAENSDDEDGVDCSVPAEEGCDRKEWAEDRGVVLRNSLSLADAVEKHHSNRKGDNRGNGESVYGLLQI